MLPASRNHIVKNLLILMGSPMSRIDLCAKMKPLLSQLELPSPIVYQSPKNYEERAISTLSKYFYLGGKKIEIIDRKTDPIQSQEKKETLPHYEIAAKITSYIVLFPITCTLFGAYLILLDRHKITPTPPEADGGAAAAAARAFQPDFPPPPPSDRFSPPLPLLSEEPPPREGLESSESDDEDRLRPPPSQGRTGDLPWVTSTWGAPDNTPPEEEVETPRKGPTGSVVVLPPLSAPQLPRGAEDTEHDITVQTVRVTGLNRSSPVSTDAASVQEGDGDGLHD